jgi:hypothetical protein
VSLSTLLACLGVSVSLYGVFAYLKGIIKDGTRPRMASWVAWCTANTIFTIVAFSEGAWLAVWINGIMSVTNVIIIAVSLKKGVKLRPGDWIDWACLISSVSCVIATAGSPIKEFGIIAAMLANAIATIPTVRHAWTKPREETWQLFAANVGASSLNITGIVIASGLSFGSIVGPLMVVIGNASMLLIGVGRRWYARTDEATALTPQPVKILTRQSLWDASQVTILQRISCRRGERNLTPF